MRASRATGVVCVVGVGMGWSVGRGHDEDEIKKRGKNGRRRVYSIKHGYGLERDRSRYVQSQPEQLDKSKIKS